MSVSTPIFLPSCRVRAAMTIALAVCFVGAVNDLGVDSALGIVVSVLLALWLLGVLMVIWVRPLNPSVQLDWEKIRRNLDTYRPLFKWLFVGTLVYGFVLSMLLAGCMGVSLDSAVELWALTVPVMYLIIYAPGIVAGQVLDWFAGRHAELPSAPVACSGWTAMNFTTPVPTSPPRFRLAFCEA